MQKESSVFLWLQSVKRVTKTLRVPHTPAGARGTGAACSRGRQAPPLGWGLCRLQVLQSLSSFSRHVGQAQCPRPIPGIPEGSGFGSFPVPSRVTPQSFHLQVWPGVRKPRGKHGCVEPILGSFQGCALRRAAAGGAGRCTDGQILTPPVTLRVCQLNSRYKYDKNLWSGVDCRDMLGDIFSNCRRIRLPVYSCHSAQTQLVKGPQNCFSTTRISAVRD